MSRGYQANRERQELLAHFGKTVSKRAEFRCEWCEGSDDLRVWDYRPDSEPAPETLALLCQPCRELADRGRGDPRRLLSIRNALWSHIPAVAEGAARVLARSREAWVREAIEECFIPEDVKDEILGRKK